MKKLLLLFAAAVMMAVSMMAEGHMKFKGVEIDGTPKEFMQKMKEKGFTCIDGDNMMIGDFAGHKDCIIKLSSSNNRIFKVGVIISNLPSSWSLLYQNYIHLKDMLTKKYGEPTKDKEEWQSRYIPRDDNSKMHELHMDRAQIGASYKTSDGFIEIRLMSIEMQGTIIIVYFDAANYQTTLDNAIDDL